MSISSVYCNEWQKLINEIRNGKPTNTNFLLAYVFLILTAETYLSGLFPYLLGFLSGRGKRIEIISHSRDSRKNLTLDDTDLLDSWYNKTSYWPLLRDKDWKDSQIYTFFNKIGFPISEDANSNLYTTYYAPIYKIRNALFHHDELVSGDVGPEPFMDKFFNLNELNNTIKLTQELITTIHEMIHGFIQKTDFSAKPRPFAIMSGEILLDIFLSHSKSVSPLLRYED